MEWGGLGPGGRSPPGDLGGGSPPGREVAKKPDHTAKPHPRRVVGPRNAPVALKDKQIQNLAVLRAKTKTINIFNPGIRAETGPRPPFPGTPGEREPRTKLKIDLNTPREIRPPGPG